MTTEQSLLLRPVKHRLERIDDYLVRLADANGFSSANTLTQYLRSWCKANSVNIRGINKADTVAKVLSQYFARKVEAKSFDQFVFAKANPHKKTCKACLTEQKAIPFYWYLHDYQVCHIHFERLESPDTNEKSLEECVNLALHPIVDFLDTNDPWLAYSSVRKNTEELRWFCWCLKRFFKTHLTTPIHIMAGMSWIDNAPPEERSSGDRFDRITSVIAEQSSQPVSDIRTVVALLLWQKMVPDHLFRVAGSGVETTTEASLEWASRHLIAYEPMLMFICDAHHAPRYTSKLRLRDYIPVLADLDEATDRSLRKAIYSCGLTTELFVVIPSRCRETEHWEAIVPPTSNK